MIRAAILSGSVVVNIIMVENLSDVQGAIDGTNADIGDTWTGSAFVSPDAPTLAQRRAARIDLMKDERDRRKRENGYQAAGKWFHSDDASRIQQLGLVLLGSNIPNGLQWRTMDGSFVTMTQTLAGQVLAAAAQHEAAIFARGEALRTQIEASSSPESIDVTAGWPAGFGA